MSKPAASRRNKRQRPNALGLAQFAEAKASTYDKQARRKTERDLNSKIVNKYRKLKARLEGSGSKASVVSPLEQPSMGDTSASTPPSKADEQIGKVRHVKRAKPAPQIQRIHAETEKERAMQQRIRQAAQLQAKEQIAKRAQALKKRKQHSSQMRKKTRSGQPVMKVRIGKMLEQLQHEAA